MLDKYSFDLLLTRFGLPSTRRNASSPNKARLYSVRGAYAASWRTSCPFSAALDMPDDLFRCCVKHRLGLAVLFDGVDSHGHHNLASGDGGRTNARHTGLVHIWRQIFIEAGGQVPDRNVERLLRNSHIPVPPDDLRRLDLIVPGLNVHRGLPLFCDVTILSPITRKGHARSGTSNRGGALFTRAERDNRATYHEVLDTGLGALFCLACETYGRFNSSCTDLIEMLAREKTRGLHPRVRKELMQGSIRRWFSLLTMSLQRAVAIAITRGAGADLPTTLLEPVPLLSDLQYH